MSNQKIDRYKIYIVKDVFDFPDIHTCIYRDTYGKYTYFIDDRIVTKEAYYAYCLEETTRARKDYPSYWNF